MAQLIILLLVIGTGLSAYAKARQEGTWSWPLFAKTMLGVSALVALAVGCVVWLGSVLGPEHAWLVVLIDLVMTAAASRLWRSGCAAHSPAASDEARSVPAVRALPGRQSDLIAPGRPRQRAPRWYLAAFKGIISPETMRTCLLALLLPLGVVPLWIDAVAEEAPQSSLAVEEPRSPFVMIGETVRVSVGKQLSIVEGRYDFRYVRRLDPAAASGRCTFAYPVFAPKDADSLADLIALTQFKLRVGDVEYEPDDFGVWPDNDEKPVQLLPDDTRVVVLIFRLPRAILRDRFNLSVRYFQPHFRFGGREVSAYLPLLPDFEAFKNEFLFSRIDFGVEFEAVDAVRLHRLSANAAVVQETPQRVKVNPVHRESIAVEVTEPPPP